MSKTFLITRPNHDLLTTYLFYFSSEIIKKAKDRNIKVLDLKKEKANQKIFLSYNKKHSPKFINFNGHGNEDNICGFDDKTIINQKNLQLLKNKIVYSLTCESAKKLGQEAIKKGCLCFLGYKNKFYLAYLNRYQYQPKNDYLAKLFLIPSNILVNSILKGLTTDQAYKKSQQAMIKNFRYMISSNAKSVEKEVASFLWLNIKNQVILGNKDSLF
jgi:hypothetical protein